MCPDCGIPVSPDAPSCPRCGLRIPSSGAAAPKAEPAAPDPPPSRGGGVTVAPTMSDDYEPDDEADADGGAGENDGPQYQAPEGPGSGIKILRDGNSGGTRAGSSPPPPREAQQGAGGQGAGSKRPSSQHKAPANRRSSAKRQSALSARGSSRWATAGLITGLLGFVPIFSPLALLFGGLAVREIKQAQGAMTGMGRAAFALIAGGLWTLAWGGVVVALGTTDFAGLWTKVQLVMNIAVLEQLPQAQETFRTSRYADQDGDGKGEYGSGAQLSSALDEIDLSALENGALGWKLVIVLPRGVNSRERVWWAFMKPVGDSAGQPWLYIDETKILRRGDNVTRKPSRRLAKKWPATSVDSFVEELFNES